MEQTTDAMGMLDLMIRPGFCVKNDRIVKVNQAAQSLMLSPGAEVLPLLATGQEEYREFTAGCLYLTLALPGGEWGASVTRMGDFDVFLLEQDEDQTELKAMALAARELREPLSNVMATADRLFPMAALQDDETTREQVARLNRGLFQMLRVIGNMSDAKSYGAAAHLETGDIRGILEEIFTHAAELMAHGGIRLTFSNLPEPVYCLLDGEKLERAVLNILSNAMKFTPKGGTIQARLTCRKNKLYLTVQDSGSGVPDDLRSSLFTRYLRQSSIEDGRFGIGLGMVLIRSTAALHGGTVLIDQPEEGGARITMTLAIRKNPPGALRSPIFRVDYAGERDHCLIELSDCLPASLYDAEMVN